MIQKKKKSWCKDQRANVKRYLAQAGVLHGEIGEWPAWHVAPYASIWAVESKKAPGCVGWWVVSQSALVDSLNV